MPSQKKLYKYKSPKKLFSSKEAIRLIRLEKSTDCSSGLRCKIVKKPVSGSPPYFALSYTWGQPIFPRELLIDDSTVISITENLDLALRRIRIDIEQPVLIWVDAVCINQQDVEERDQQVRLMGRIYSQAAVVIVWVGDDNYAGDGARCLFRLSQIGGGPSIASSEDHPVRWPEISRARSSPEFNKYRQRPPRGNLNRHPPVQCCSSGTAVASTSLGHTPLTPTLAFWS